MCNEKSYQTIIRILDHRHQVVREIDAIISCGLMWSGDVYPGSFWESYS